MDQHALLTREGLGGAVSHRIAAPLFGLLPPRRSVPSFNETHNFLNIATLDIQQLFTNACHCLNHQDIVLGERAEESSQHTRGLSHINRVFQTYLRKRRDRTLSSNTARQIVDRIRTTHDYSSGFALKGVDMATLATVIECPPFGIAQDSLKLVERHVCADNDLHLLKNPRESILHTTLSLQSSAIPSQCLYQRIPS